MTPIKISNTGRYKLRDGTIIYVLGIRPSLAPWSVIGEILSEGTIERWTTDGYYLADIYEVSDMDIVKYLDEI